MTQFITAPLSAKGQLTMPKAVRKALNLTSPGSTVGFLVNDKTHTAILTKMEIVPAEASFSKGDLRKLSKLAKQPDGKTFPSMDAFLKDLKNR